MDRQIALERSLLMIAKQMQIPFLRRTCPLMILLLDFRWPINRVAVKGLLSAEKKDAVAHDYYASQC